MMKKKKKKQLVPLVTIEALIPRNFVEEFQERATRERLDGIAPWRLKIPKFYKCNLSFGNGDPLRMLVAKERIEDLRGNLLRFTSNQRRKKGRMESGDRDIHPTERLEAQYQNFTTALVTLN